MPPQTPAIFESVTERVKRLPEVAERTRTPQ
jgi:hypothetical protein